MTRLGAIEEMAGMDMLCSDKTGTLTLNKMVLEPEDCAFYEKGETYDTVVMQAALAAKWKEPPRDALDTMVLVVRSLPARTCFFLALSIPKNALLPSLTPSSLRPFSLSLSLSLSED